jgi:5-methylcytosine-specific restriction endonuclease McrA
VSLHIVQGGVENGDKVWLERAAKRRLRSAPTWVVPRDARIGDDVVVYIAEHGFFATAKIDSPPQPRRGWRNRYGATLSGIQLVLPAISLGTIQRRIPDLKWANYPRSITTPSPLLARRIFEVLRQRRTRVPDHSKEALAVASLDELRQVALLRASPNVPPRIVQRLYRARSNAIRAYVLKRAEGTCEACGAGAPFRNVDGSFYLEPHHVTRLADDGPDHPAKVIGLCPNCHRRAHLAEDAKAFNRGLIKKLRRIEAAV